MRICMVSTDYLPNSGGIAAHVSGLSQALVALGHDVVVLTVSHRRARGHDACENGVRVVRVPRLGDRLQATRAWLMCRALERLHGRAPLDIVHFHGYGPDAKAVHCFGRAPAVFTNHSSGFIRDVESGLGGTLWQAINHACEFIAPSHELFDLLVQLGCPEDHATYIPNAVDTSVFRPDASRGSGSCLDALGASAGGLILCPRRLEPKNGVRFLIEAAPSVVASCPECRVLIAGDGTEASALRRRVAELGLGGHVVFLGNVAREDMPGLMAACDIVVLPSIKEATSIAGLEAMACGKPVVGTTVGGIPEIVADGETGLLVPPADPAALASAILGLVGDRHLQERLGAAARRRAEQEFSWPVIARRTLAVYERACPRKGG